MTFQEFLGQRNGQLNQFFPHPNAKGTVLVSSHIWWTEQIALAVYNLGYNLLIHFPFYFLYTDEAAWNNFDGLWDQIRHNIKEFKVDLILAGNSTAMAPHPKTHEMLHDAAGIPVVNYWWDEPRATPPFASRGSSPQDYLAMLKNPRSLNVIWDIDVLEELSAFYGLANTVHVPLATDPGFWQQTPVPMDKRAIRVCFLGNCHFDSAYVETDEDPLVRWARQGVRDGVDDGRAGQQLADRSLPKAALRLLQAAPAKRFLQAAAITTVDIAGAQTLFALGRYFRFDIAHALPPRLAVRPFPGSGRAPNPSPHGRTARLHAGQCPGSAARNAR